MVTQKEQSSESPVVVDVPVYELCFNHQNPRLFLSMSSPKKI